MSSPSHGIVGAHGSMGQSLQGLLRNCGPVVCVGEDWPEEERRRLWACDIIWLAMPRDNVDAVLNKKVGHLEASQLVIDICSVKRRISHVLKDIGAEHLSLHPIHGPHIRPERQRWFLIGRRDEVSARAEHVLSYLESLGITFLKAESEDDHDFKMGVILGLKEILTVVIDRLVETYANDCRRVKPDIASLLDWSSPVANAVYGAYVHSVLSSNDWLRADLVERSYGDLRRSARSALLSLAEELPTMPFRDVFEAQRARVERTVAEPRRSHISKWINFGFENASPEFEWDGTPSEVTRRMGAVLPLSTENVTWRRFGEDDRVALTKILCDATVMRGVFTGGPLTNSEASAFIDANFLEGGGDTPGMGVLCRRGDENVIGFAGIIPCKWPLEGQAEFGVVLHAEAQSMRYGHEIGKKLIAVAHRDLGLKRVYALCHPENAASIRWLASIGMAATELVIPNYHGSEPRRVFMIEQ